MVPQALLASSTTTMGTACSMAADVLLRDGADDQNLKVVTIACIEGVRSNSYRNLTSSPRVEQVGLAATLAHIGLKCSSQLPVLQMKGPVLSCPFSWWHVTAALSSRNLLIFFGLDGTQRIQRHSCKIVWSTTLLNMIHSHIL